MNVGSLSTLLLQSLAPSAPPPRVSRFEPRRRGKGIRVVARPSPQALVPRHRLAFRAEAAGCCRSEPRRWPSMRSWCASQSSLPASSASSPARPPARPPLSSRLVGGVSSPRPPACLAAESGPAGVSAAVSAQGPPAGGHDRGGSASPRTASRETVVRPLARSPPQRQGHSSPLLSLLVALPPASAKPPVAPSGTSRLIPRRHSALPPGVFLVPSTHPGPPETHFPKRTFFALLTTPKRHSAGTARLRPGITSRNALPSLS